MKKPRAQRPPITLTEREAIQLLTAQNNELAAQWDLRELADEAKARLEAMRRAKAAVMTTLTKKYHLDPTKAYSLDDETLMLVPQAKP